MKISSKVVPGDSTFALTTIPPMVVLLILVTGVFLARWSLPALILGTRSVRADVSRQGVR